jgi:hypothetical protein
LQLMPPTQNSSSSTSLNKTTGLWNNFNN